MYGLTIGQAHYWCISKGSNCCNGMLHSCKHLNLCQQKFQTQAWIQLCFVKSIWKWNQISICFDLEFLWATYFIEHHECFNDNNRSVMTHLCTLGLVTLQHVHRAHIINHAQHTWSPTQPPPGVSTYRGRICQPDAGRGQTWGWPLCSVDTLQSWPCFHTL